MKTQPQPAKVQHSLQARGKMRVIIADVSLLFAQVLGAALEQQGRYEMVAYTSNGVDALTLCGLEQAELLIMDTTLPDLSGVELVRRVREKCRDVRVLAVTSERSRERMLELLGAQPHGFVHKSEPLETFINVLRAVAGGMECYSAHVRRVLDEAVPRASAARPSLTTREREVLGLLALGLSSKQIATEMTLSIHTVGHYRAEIMSKLNIHDIAGLTCYALQNGVVRA